MKTRFFSMAFAAGFFLMLTTFGWCQDKARAPEWIEKAGQGSVNWSAGYLEAVGMGAPPEKAAGKISARPAALRAAKVDAMRHLREVANAVQIDSYTRIRDVTEKSDVVHTQVEGLVKGAQVVRQQYLPDQSAEVTLRMPLYGDLSRVVLPMTLEQKKKTPASAPETPAAGASVACTGWVIDARGIGAHPAMSPRIFDEDGRELYGLSNVGHECAIEQGMTGYARDLAVAQGNPRVAANPLTVKGIKTAGPGQSDIVIKNADAQAIRSSVENASLRKTCRMIIVLD